MTERIIDRFTPEEIEQIKGELGLLEDERNSKSFVTKESRDKLWRFIVDNYDDMHPKIRNEIKTQIYLLTDMMVANYEYRGIMYAQTYKTETFKRIPYVLPEKKEDYKRVHAKLVDLFIEEYSKVLNPKISEKTEV